MPVLYLRLVVSLSLPPDMGRAWRKQGNSTLTFSPGRQPSARLRLSGLLTSKSPGSIHSGPPSRRLGGAAGRGEGHRRPGVPKSSGWEVFLG